MLRRYFSCSRRLGNAAALQSSRVAARQPYQPYRPVNISGRRPSPAGGPVDVMARLRCNPSRRLGPKVIVENRRRRRQPLGSKLRPPPTLTANTLWSSASGLI